MEYERNKLVENTIKSDYFKILIMIMTVMLVITLPVWIIPYSIYKKFKRSDT